jgi:hypothetical protein
MEPAKVNAGSTVDEPLVHDHNYAITVSSDDPVIVNNNNELIILGTNGTNKENTRVYENTRRHENSRVYENTRCHENSRRYNNNNDNNNTGISATNEPVIIGNTF